MYNENTTTGVAVLIFLSSLIGLVIFIWFVVKINAIAEYLREISYNTTVMRRAMEASIEEDG